MHGGTSSAYAIFNSFDMTLTLFQLQRHRALRSVKLQVFLKIILFIYLKKNCVRSSITVVRLLHTSTRSYWLRGVFEEDDRRVIELGR